MVTQKKMSKKLETVFMEAMSRFEDVSSAEKPLRDAAIEDNRFAHVPGAQWDDGTRQKLENMPLLEVNKIAPAIRQVVGDQKQNQIGIKVRPMGNGATLKLAEIRTKLIRAIEKMSNAADVYGDAYKEAVTGGMGAFYITTDYEAEDGFNQEIRIMPIRSAAANVFFDPSATGSLKEDARWCFVRSSMNIDEFRRQWPGAVEDNFESDLGSTFHRGWYNDSENVIFIADYWVKEHVKKVFAQTKKGRIFEVTEETQGIFDELVDQGDAVVRQKEVNCHKIVHYKISGNTILEGPNDWAGRYIPVIPVYGYTAWVDDHFHFSGMVRMARDAQKLYNYTISAKAKSTNDFPKVPFLVTPRMINKYRDIWEKFNIDNPVALPYDPDPTAPGGKPERIGPVQIQGALIEQGNSATNDIQETTGLYRPSLGRETGQSGRAILAEQRRGDIGTYEMLHNLGRAIERGGMVILDLMPYIYDTAREVRILGEDGAADLVRLNDKIFDKETGRDVPLNDMSVGKYDLAIDIGPSYKTQREETRNIIIGMLQADPSFMSFAGDLVAKSFDWPMAQELEKRWRKRLLSQGVIEPNEEEKKQMAEAAKAQAEAPPDPMEQFQLRMMAQELNKKAYENESLQIKNYADVLDLDRKVADIDKIYAEVRETSAKIFEMTNQPQPPQEKEQRDREVLENLNREGFEPERSESEPLEQMSPEPEETMPSEPVPGPTAIPEQGGQNPEDTLEEEVKGLETE